MTTRTRMTNAERRKQSRAALISAAERLFLAHGFHATSVDQIAEAAGYTKGAVYSHFNSKEDLFLALYEREAGRAVKQVEAAIGTLGPRAGLEQLVTERRRRDKRGEQWLAVFLEFWSYVIRNPSARRRFAEIHTRALEPMMAATRELAAERALELPVAAEGFTLAMNAMQLGLVLEKFVRPELVDAALGEQMLQFVFDCLERLHHEEGNE